MLPHSGLLNIGYSLGNDSWEDSEEGEGKNRSHQQGEIDATSFQCHKFALGRESPEGEEDADQERHRDGEDQKGRQQAGEEAEDLAKGDALVDDHLHELLAAPHHQDEGEDHQGHEHWRGNFA